MELEKLVQAWKPLAGGVPLRTPEWLLTWWRHFGRECELFAIAVTDLGGSLVGLAPWMLEHCRTSGRVVRFLGSGEVCSDYLSILAQEDRAAEVVDALAQWLTDAETRDNGSDRWDLLHLTGAASADPNVAQLTERLWDRGNSIHRRAGLRCWRIALPGTWDEYVATLSKSHRKQVRRAQRRVLESGRAVLHTLAPGEDPQPAMEILVDLHQRRRATLGEPGCFASETFSAFLHEAAVRLHRSGMLRLHWLELDGRPVTAEFHLAGGGVTYAYQAGVDPETLDEEPGRLITIATIKKAIEEGQTGFDFMRGDEAYKPHWRAVPHESVDLRIVPQRATSRIRHGIWLAGDSVKNWIKSSLQRSAVQ